MATNKDPGGINSTTTPLAADGVFTGGAEKVDSVSSISVMVHADVASAPQGLSLEFSSDGNNWDFKKTYTVPAGISKVATFACVGEFFRVVYTNGSTAQAAFRLYAREHRTTASMHDQLVPAKIVGPLTASGDLRNAEPSLIFGGTFEYTVSNTELTTNINTCLLK